MKTIFTLLLSTLFSFSLLAYDGTRLTINSISSNKMYAEVDGRRYNLDGNTVSIHYIRPGYHTIKVFWEVKRNNGRRFDFGFGNYKRQELVYNNRVYLKNGYHFDILINRFGKVMADEQRIDSNNELYNDDDDHYDRDGDYDRNRDWNDNDNRYDKAMSDYDFNRAKESLRQEWLENNRMTAAKQIFDRNYFNSRQVKEMLLLFTFENNRLDLAKYAYGHTVDKGNYLLVNDVFTFNNNKEELARYIRDYR